MAQNVEIFKQGEMVETITSNVKTAEVNAKQAVEEITEAKEINDDSGGMINKACFAAIIIVFVLLIMMILLPD